MDAQRTRKLLRTFMILCGLSNSAFVQAGIVFLEDPPNCFLMLNGGIDADSVSRVIESPCERVTITLDSSGGDVKAAMTFGRWLRSNQATAIVRTEASCLSSCALLYIGATHRMNGGSIGLHRPYLGGTPLPASEVTETIQAMMISVRNYVAEMNITQDFANIMQNTPPADVRIFRGTEIQQLVPDRDFVDEELEMARNAEAFRLTVEEYRRRDRIADAECVEKSFVSPKAYYECRTPIILEITKVELEARQSRAFEVCFQEGLAMVPYLHDPDHPATKAFSECSRDVMAGRK